VTALLGGHHHHGHGTPATFPETDAKQHQRQTQSELSRVSSNNSQQPPQRSEEEDVAAVAGTTTTLVVHPICCADDPVGDLEEIQRMAAEEVELSASFEKSHDAEVKMSEELVDEEHQKQQHNSDDENNNAPTRTTTTATATTSHHHHHDEEKLMRMSINTALAIALHNFPEGLATFVATLNDPKVGAVLAMAIAIHNIPEGLCVAMPIYYATGNRWKAFRWGVLSGLSEPIAALLGWAVLANSFDDTLYAIMFGVVAGMMVIISARELLPTAHRYDPDDHVVTYSFIGGMFIMALSLVLFKV
jgi:zinc transporter ZupT